MAVQSKLNYSKALKAVDPDVPQPPPTPPPPPTPSPLFVCGWCNTQAAPAINTLCPSCEGDEKAQEAWSEFQAWHHEQQQQQEPNFESEEVEEEEDLEVFNCMFCGAVTPHLTTHSRVVNGEWVTEHLPFCSAMHHAIYSLNLPH